MVITGGNKQRHTMEIHRVVILQYCYYVCACIITSTCILGESFLTFLIKNKVDGVGNDGVGNVIC